MVAGAAELERAGLGVEDCPAARFSTVQSDGARHRYPWDRIQTCFPFTEEGIMDAVESAMAMRSVKAAIVPDESIG